MVLKSFNTLSCYTAGKNTTGLSGVVGMIPTTITQLTQLVLLQRQLEAQQQLTEVQQQQMEAQKHQMEGLISRLVHAPGSSTQVPSAASIPKFVLRFHYRLVERLSGKVWNICLSQFCARAQDG